ncbi:STE/STE11 protein kinase [Aphanomyces invadans]|uniref:STE/STE11 protein kinase n=1 Tax=Aphanomyces invadans TaxID=157072 RepID=A0A024TBU8_9STRA|nr:STE/STE11 protein kinase [Aphanomyces invadans]ETV91459.1 STE/STE11 protein kinase [Aphanomyces invadans]|eukprot:XP_008879911.1 STE/STE11 protein kinase [Aphanomyces invadans]
MGGGASKPASLALEQDTSTAALTVVTPLPSTSPKAASSPKYQARRHSQRPTNPSFPTIPPMEEQVEFSSMKGLHDRGGVAVHDENERGSEADISREDTDSVHDAGSPPFVWKKGELLGSGSFGSVYLARNETTGDLMAVKEISYAEETTDEIAAIQQEVAVLRSLNHPHIVTYIGSEFHAATSTLYIFTEWVPGGSLEDNTKTFGCSESVAQNYMSQVLLGVQYLHSRHVIHYDIKPSNILIDQHGAVKLADFGASRLLSASSIAKSKSMRGTPYYMAPEVIKQQAHDTKADIWSLGCTLLKMLTGVPLWKDLKFQTQVALFYHIANLTSPPPLPPCLTDLSKSFVLACLQIPPDDRWSADQLLRHPFIRQRHVAPPSRRSSTHTTHARASTAAPSTTTSSSNYAQHHRKTLTLDFDAPDDDIDDGSDVKEAGHANGPKHDNIPPRVCKTAFAHPDNQSTPLQLPHAARVHHGPGTGPVQTKSPRPPASDVGKVAQDCLPRAAKHSAATTSRSTSDEKLDNHHQRHGKHPTPPKTSRGDSSEKLPSLTPPKMKLSDPHVPTIAMNKQAAPSENGADGRGGDRRRPSLPTESLDCDLTIPEAMPILGPSNSPDKITRPNDPRMSRPSENSAADVGSIECRVSKNAFDDTPILTDAAKRERDFAVEREEQKRRMKEQREREWREEQEAYKRSLQR